jgi:hypothetical protein
MRESRGFRLQAEVFALVLIAVVACFEAHDAGIGLDAEPAH